MLAIALTILITSENDTSEDDSDLEPYPMEEESEDEQESRKEPNQKLGRPAYVPKRYKLYVAVSLIANYYNQICVRPVTIHSCYR